MSQNLGNKTLVFESIDCNSVSVSGFFSIPASIPASISRTKIPGGWIVYFESGSDNTSPVGFFVPDPEHQWDGSSLP